MESPHTLQQGLLSPASSLQLPARLLCPCTHPLHPPLQVRCVTLVARDAANLQRALGAGVDLAPIWSALATRVRWAGCSRGCKQRRCCAIVSKATVHD